MAEAPSDIAIQASALVKTYRMGEVEVQALRGVDFDLRRRELVVLLGPSGSGKSTLLNILGGLDVPTSGTLAYAGHDLSHPTEEELTQYRRQHIGFIFQFYNLIPSLTARENVALVADMRRQAHVARRRARARRALRAARPLPVADVGRRAAARRDRARGRQEAGDPPLRRAHGRARRRDGAARARGARSRQPRLGTSIAVVTHNAPIAQMADRVVTLADGRIASDRANPDRKAPSEVSW